MRVFAKEKGEKDEKITVLAECSSMVRI